MTRASNDAGAPEVKQLLDTIVDPLTKQYTGGGLDDLTRTDLMKFLAETHDPRSQPALAKALKDFEMGKTDDEVRVACESINAMAKARRPARQDAHRSAVGHVREVPALQGTRASASTRTCTTPS